MCALAHYLSTLHVQQGHICWQHHPRPSSSMMQSLLQLLGLDTRTRAHVFEDRVACTHMHVSTSVHLRVHEYKRRGNAHLVRGHARTSQYPLESTKCTAARCVRESRMHPRDLRPGSSWRSVMSLPAAAAGPCSVCRRVNAQYHILPCPCLLLLLDSAVFADESTHSATYCHSLRLANFNFGALLGNASCLIPSCDSDGNLLGTTVRYHVFLEIPLRELVLVALAPVAAAGNGTL